MCLGWFLIKEALTSLSGLLFFNVLNLSHLDFCNNCLSTASLLHAIVSDRAVRWNSFLNTKKV